MKKTFAYGLTALVILVVLYGAYGVFYLLPIIIEQDYSFTQEAPVELAKGDTIKLLDSFDFDSGDYSLYVVFEDITSMRHSPWERFPKVLYTDDPVILNGLKETFQLIYTGGDMATCQSYINLIKDDEIVLKQGICLDEINPGLQSSQYGWISFTDSDKILTSFNQLTPVYWPVIIL